MQAHLVDVEQDRRKVTPSPVMPGAQSQRTSVWFFNSTLVGRPLTHMAPLYKLGKKTNLTRLMNVRHMAGWSERD